MLAWAHYLSFYYYHYHYFSNLIAFLCGGGDRRLPPFPPLTNVVSRSFSEIGLLYVLFYAVCLCFSIKNVIFCFSFRDTLQRLANIVFFPFLPHRHPPHALSSTCLYLWVSFFFFPPPPSDKPAYMYTYAFDSLLYMLVSLPFLFVLDFILPSKVAQNVPPTLPSLPPLCACLSYRLLILCPFPSPRLHMCVGVGAALGCFSFCLPPCGEWSACVRVLFRV